MMKRCVECAENLTKDEVALNKKLISKNTKEFLCLGCLSVFLNSDREILEDKIVQFKDEGCTLFQ